VSSTYPKTGILSGNKSIGETKYINALTIAIMLPIGISLYSETHQKALDILEGRKHDLTFYPVIYGAKDDDDWTDPKVWTKVNPSLGITVGMDKVEAACESAKQNPAEENSFRQ